MTATVRTLHHSIARRVAFPMRPVRGARFDVVRLLLVILLLAVLVLGAGVGYLYYRVHGADVAEASRAAALPAARTHAEEILSYDYRTLKRDLARAKANTTGGLRRDYGRLTEKVVGPQARKNKVVVRANVAGASVVEAAPDRVVTLLFVDQTTQSDLLDGPRVDQSRVRMTLREVDGQWLAAEIQAL